MAHGTAKGATGRMLWAEHLSARLTTRWADLLAVGGAGPSGTGSQGAVHAAKDAAALTLPQVGRTMPSMPALETDGIVQDDDTFAVVFARTGTMVQLDGVPQVGLALDRTDGVADHLEAIDRIAATRGAGWLDI